MDTIAKLLDQIIKLGRIRVQGLDHDETLKVLATGVLQDGEWLCLPNGIEPLDPGYLLRELRASGFEPEKFEVFGCAESTNTILLQRARDISIDGHVLLAETQTGGRGRKGREWISPVGLSISLSMGITLRVSAKRLGTASLAAGVAVARALETLGVPSPQVKWPNDVLAGGAKIAGILIEVATSRTLPELVVGIGINTGSAAQLRDRVDQRVTAVCEHASGCSRNAIAAQTILAVRAAFRELERGGFSALARQWKRRDALANQPVQVVTPSQTLTGIARGIDPDGGLILETEGELRRIIGGEVSIRPSK